MEYNTWIKGKKQYDTTKFEHIIDFIDCNVGTGSGPPVVAVACM